MKASKIIRLMSVVFAAACLLVPAAGMAKNATIDILICYPGGSVRAKDAKPAMDSMIGVIESIGGWSKGTIATHFTAKMKECRKLLQDKKPEFAILSLGLYLENYKKYNLAPLTQPKINNSTTDTYRLLVRKGTFKSLEDLKGKTIGGQLLSEIDFLKRIVFKSKIDPETFFKLKPSRRALRSLRKLSKGKIDAVIVNQQQYGGLSSLPFADKLEVVFTSEKLPQMGVVVNQKKTSKEDRQRLLKALSSMCTHNKGKKLCELFGIDAFIPSEIKTFKQVITLWNAGK